MTFIVDAFSKPLSHRERGWGEGSAKADSRRRIAPSPQPDAQLGSASTDSSQPELCARVAPSARLRPESELGSPAHDTVSSFRVLATWVLLLATLFSATAFAHAATDHNPLQFTSVAEERRFHALVSELRCVMCQNQSLADSNAQIAVDLRQEVLALMRAGKSNAQVKDFLVARYGDFVLYRPRVESSTWLLWFGPALLLLGGGAVVAGVVRKRAGTRVVADDDGQEW